MSLLVRFLLVILAVASRPCIAGTPTAATAAAGTPPAETAKPAEGLVNYGLLDHAISIVSIRAGNHDESGVNDYYFTYRLAGIVSAPTGSEGAEQKSVVLGEESLGALKINALARWDQDPKGGQVISADIAGDDIRKLIAQTMKQLDADERDIAVRVDLLLYEKSKKFYFFGDDRKVAETSYFVIPPKGSFSQLRTDNRPVIQDGKSTVITFQVSYKSPAKTGSGR